MVKRLEALDRDSEAKAPVKTYRTTDLTQIPFDNSPEFLALCDACRRGDVPAVRHALESGVNVNAMDEWNYQPLCLASLCGHLDVVTILLESGAVCDRDTFQGERAVISALTDEIRDTLLKYNYRRTEVKGQPLARYLVGLLGRGEWSDVSVELGGVEFNLHRWLLAARCAYLREGFAAGKTLKELLPEGIDAETFQLVVRYLYVAEISDMFDTAALEAAAKHFQLPRLEEFATGDNRIRTAVQRAEVETAQKEIEAWTRSNVLNYILLPYEIADDFTLPADHPSYADVLLRIDEDADDVPSTELPISSTLPPSPSSVPSSSPREPGVRIYPAHKCMLRSEYFTTMFNSPIALEASAYRPVITLDIASVSLETALLHFYTELTHVPIESALDTLYVSDMLLSPSLQQMCIRQIRRTGPEDKVPYDAKDVLLAAWHFQSRDLELHAAKLMAYDLERYLQDEEFAALVQESAAKVKDRHEVDTIEVIDDIRYHLDRRFRLRMMDFSAVLGGINLRKWKEEKDEGSEKESLQVDQLETGSEQTKAEPESQEGKNKTRKKRWEAQEAFGVEKETIDKWDIGKIQAIEYETLMEGIDELLEKLGLSA